MLSYFLCLVFFFNVNFIIPNICSKFSHLKSRQPQTWWVEKMNACHLQQLSCWLLFLRSSAVWMLLTWIKVRFSGLMEKIPQSLWCAAALKLQSCRGVEAAGRSRQDCGDSALLCERDTFLTFFPPSPLFPRSRFAPELLLPTRAAVLVTHDILMSVTLCLLLAGASYNFTTTLQRSSKLLRALFSHLLSKGVDLGLFWSCLSVLIFAKLSCPSFSWIYIKSRIVQNKKIAWEKKWTYLN